MNAGVPSASTRRAARRHEPRAAASRPRAADGTGDRVPGERSAARDHVPSAVCLVPAPSAWSPSAAPATRSTPKSSPHGWRRAAGRCGARARTRTSSSSTPAASSRPPSRSPSTSCSPRRTRAPRWPPSAAWPSGTAPSSPGELPEAQVLSFDDYADIAARLDDVLAGGAARARGAGTAGRCCRSARPARRRARRRPTGPTLTETDPRPAAGHRPGFRPAADPAAAVRRGDRAAEDRLRLRPALLVLRDPVLPRGVRLPPPARSCWPRPSWLAARGSASCCW